MKVKIFWVIGINKYSEKISIAYSIILKIQKSDCMKWKSFLHNKGSK